MKTINTVPCLSNLIPGSSIGVGYNRYTTEAAEFYLMSSHWRPKTHTDYKNPLPIPSTSSPFSWGVLPSRQGGTQHQGPGSRLNLRLCRDGALETPAILGTYIKGNFSWDCILPQAPLKMFPSYLLFEKEGETGKDPQKIVNYRKSVCHTLLSELLPHIWNFSSPNPGTFDPKLLEVFLSLKDESLKNNLPDFS